MQVVISMRIVAGGRGASDYMLYSFIRPAVGILLIQGYIYIYQKGRCHGIQATCRRTLNSSGSPWVRWFKIIYREVGTTREDSGYGKDDYRTYPGGTRIQTFLLSIFLPFFLSRLDFGFPLQRASPVDSAYHTGIPSYQDTPLLLHVLFSKRASGLRMHVELVINIDFFLFSFSFISFLLHWAFRYEGRRLGTARYAGTYSTYLLHPLYDLLAQLEWTGLFGTLSRAKGILVGDCRWGLSICRPYHGFEGNCEWGVWGGNESAQWMETGLLLGGLDGFLSCSFTTAFFFRWFSFLLMNLHLRLYTYPGYTMGLERILGYGSSGVVTVQTLDGIGWMGLFFYFGCILPSYSFFFFSPSLAIQSLSSCICAQFAYQPTKP